MNDFPEESWLRYPNLKELDHDMPCCAPNSSFPSKSLIPAGEACMDSDIVQTPSESEFPFFRVWQGS